MAPPCLSLAAALRSAPVADCVTTDVSSPAAEMATYVTPDFGLTPSFGPLERLPDCPWMRSSVGLRSLNGLPPRPEAMAVEDCGSSVRRSCSMPAVPRATSMANVMRTMEMEDFYACEKSCPKHGPVTWGEWRAADHQRQMEMFKAIWLKRHGPNADAEWQAQKETQKNKMAAMGSLRSSPTASPPYQRRRL